MASKSRRRCSATWTAPSWLWADLLPKIGINAFTMSINMYRGRRPAPDLNAFWWQGPGGDRLLTFNGPHYLYGIFRYGLGDMETVEKLLPDAARQAERRATTIPTTSSTPR